MSNTSSERFILTTNIYNNPTNDDILVSKNQIMEGKVATDMESMALNNQQIMTTKKSTT